MGDTKVLELIHSNIDRLAGNGFVIKGWSVTLATAVIGFAIQGELRGFAFVGCVPLVIFWFLDSYFLALERGMRSRFALAAAAAVDGRQSTYDVSPVGMRALTVLHCAFRPAVALTHVPLILVLLGIGWQLMP